MRPLIAWVALLLLALCVLLAFITGLANGLLIIATVSLAVWGWAAGAFTREFWIADDETSRRLSAVDAELDFIESVNADIATLTRKDTPS